MPTNPSPGPWTACPCNARRHFRVECATTANDCEPVAECRGPDRAANARLIAAAPDMLEALRGLLADAYLADPLNADRMAAARAAIAKATAEGTA